MGDPEQKQKRRARRKRNLIARDLRLPKFRHQVKPSKLYKRKDIIKDIQDDLHCDEA